jgi:MFS family permease
MIIASVAAGYWTARAGARLPIVIGCAAFAAGLLLANPLITTHPNYLLLSLALALAGIGIGITVVPVTATVLNAVIPERSGMAASATNTSREIGAVTGVAVLGALVFSQLNSSLTANLQALNVPVGEKVAILGFKSTIISFIETGQAPTNYSSYGPIVGKVISAAYASFGDGLHDALYLSAGLVIVAGLLAAVTLRGRQPDLLR